MCNTCKAFRIGIVESVDPKEFTARVHYLDTGKVSHPLQVLVPCAHTDKGGLLPNVGDQVLAIEIPPTYTFGFIVGAQYNKVDRPAIEDGDKKRLQISDGAYVEIDKKNHKIKLFALTDFEIETIGQITINGAMVTINDKPVAPLPDALGDGQ